MSAANLDSSLKPKNHTKMKKQTKLTFSQGKLNFTKTQKVAESVREIADSVSTLAKTSALANQPATLVKENVDSTKKNNNEKQARNRWFSLPHFYDQPEFHWQRVERALQSPKFETAQDFCEMIRSYNNPVRVNGMNLNVLERYITNDSENPAHLLHELLPAICRLALQLPNLFPRPFALLHQGKDQYVSMTKQQAACLLANGFLCTYRNGQDRSYPGLQFFNIFSENSNRRWGRSGVLAEKIKCMLHYFKRVTSEPPTGMLTFHRRVLPDEWKKFDFESSTAHLHGIIEVSSQELIEDQSQQYAHLDFANKYIGGGVLGYGCVQEEILFMIRPECLVSLLFTEVLGPREALLIKGADRYSSYSGYSSTFKFTGDFRETIPVDAKGHRDISIICIDAKHYTNPYHRRNSSNPNELYNMKLSAVLEQFDRREIDREIRKALIGFLPAPSFPSPRGLATGNWGCGAFGGISQLKACIQFIAASLAFKQEDGAYRFKYLTFNDSSLEPLRSFHGHEHAVKVLFEHLIANGTTVKQLYGWLFDYKSEILEPSVSTASGTEEWMDLFTFLWLKSNLKSSTTSVQREDNADTVIDLKEWPALGS